MAWPTRTVVASAMPMGIMKHSADTLIAIWCAAAGTAPRRAISSAVTMNRLPSINTVTPMGRPVRKQLRDLGGTRRIEVGEQFQVGETL